VSRYRLAVLLSHPIQYTAPLLRAPASREEAVRDLVRPGQNGYIFPHGSVDGLFDAPRRLVESAERRAQFGCRSLEIVSDWDIENTADGIAQAVISVSDRRSA